MTKKIKAAKEAAPTVWANLEQLTESAALLTVSAYSGFQAYKHDYDGLYVLLMVAAVAIALRGGVEFLKHLARK